MITLKRLLVRYEKYETLSMYEMRPDKPVQILQWLAKF